jgi:Putative Flp pilus-assembly TadE/G-like
MNTVLNQKQAGYASLFFALMLGLIIFSAYYMYEPSAATNEKIKLQNIADAAAYSASLVHARELNYIAYTNRAMIANQVLIAQSISLISWSRFASDLTNRIETLSKFAGPAAPFLVGGLQVALNSVEAGLEAAEIALRGYIVAVDAVIEALSLSQKTMHISSMAAIQNTIRTIVAENDASVELAGLVADSTMGVGQLKHLSFIEKIHLNHHASLQNKKEHQKKMNQMKEIILSSRDEFSKIRQKKSEIHIIPIDTKFRLQYHGSTAMTEKVLGKGYYNWAAIDTLSLHIGTPKSGLFSGRKWKEFSIAAGAAQVARETVTEDHFDDSYGQYMFGFKNKAKTDLTSTFEKNKESSNLAMSYKESDENIYKRFGGIQSFYAISEEGFIDETPGFIVVLKKKHKNKIIQNRKKVDLIAMAKASAKFDRPSDLFPRIDNAREYGNLLSPYWFGKLVEASTAEKEAIRLSLKI